MATLYEILGLGQRATLEQVEQAFILQSEKLQNEGLSSEQDAFKLRAVKDAFAILSSPVRRKAYDDKLNKASQITYEVVETSPLPWLKILLLSAVLLGGGIYFYKVQENKARAELLALEVAKAKAEAQAAQLKADAELAHLEKQKLLDQQRSVAAQRYETEKARRDGQQIHSNLEQQAARNSREREQAERQAKYDQDREAQMAQRNVQNQNAAMQRALNIPIPGGQ